MRTLVYTTLCTALTGTPIDAGAGEFKIWQIGNLGVAGVPASPPKPFILVQQGVTAPFQAVSEQSDAENVPFQVYVYDEQGSYVRIDALIRRFEPAIKHLAGSVSLTGARCLGVTWGGVSQDFIDPTFDAAARFASFTLTGSHHKEA